MAMNTLGVLLHVAFAVYFTIVMHFDVQIVTPGVMEFGGRWKYLTFLDLVFQLSYFLFASLVDIIDLIRGQETTSLLSIRDVFFVSFAFPYGILVATSFWGIYAIDRELIFPKLLDNIIPNWINHALHTWCAVAVILEAAVNCHNYPRNRVGITLMLGFGAAYISWLFYIANTHNYWVYAFLRVMESNARLSFFAICATILVFYYMIGKWMTAAIWRGASSSNYESVQEKKTASKKKVKKIE